MMVDMVHRDDVWTNSTSWGHIFNMCFLLRSRTSDDGGGRGDKREQCFDTVTPKYTISEKAFVEGRGILLDNTLS